MVVALRVAADPLRTFEVFTGEIGLWWRPNGLFQFTPRGPGVLAFEGGEGGRLIETMADGKVFEVGRIKAWEPGSRLVFGWRCAGFGPDQDTEVEVTFEAVGEVTRVSVEHRGWDTVPVENVARHGFPNAVFLQREAEWWHDLLSRLRERAGRK